MLLLKACAGCLSTDLKLYDMNYDGQLRKEYNLASGLTTTQSTGLPHYLCVYCTAHLRRLVTFRQKCQLVYSTLQEILNKNQEVKPYHLEALNTNILDLLKPTLSFVDLKKCHKEVIFHWVETNNVEAPEVTQKINAPVVQRYTIQNNNSSVNENIMNRDLMLEVTPVDAKCVKEEENYLISIECFDNSNVRKCKLNSLIDENIVKKVRGTFDNDVSDDELNDGDELLKEEYVETKKESNKYKEENKKTKYQADGFDLEPEYAKMIPLTFNESKAVLEIYKLNSKERYRCQHCSKSYFAKHRLDTHLRLHDPHISGTFLCELCNNYYKTESVLKTHMTEKHMYKYICRKCPEVNFERVSAKQHFFRSHVQTGGKKGNDLLESRPSWMSSKGLKRIKGVVAPKPVRKAAKLPDDFLVYSALSQEDQYSIINERKKSKNYTSSQFKCELCFRGFREIETYNNHMKKHDPVSSGPVQCDMCKLHFNNTRQLYDHMKRLHLSKYTCQKCGFHCFNTSKAHQHYKFHKNVTYPCPHCKKEFKKISSRLTHIRVDHPSDVICNICGHSFVSNKGLYYHKSSMHTKEEIESSKLVSVQAKADTRAGSDAEMDAEVDPLYCAECCIRFACQLAYDTHLGSSKKHALTNESTKGKIREAGVNARATARKMRLAQDVGSGRKGGRGPSTQVHNNGVAIASVCKVCGKRLPNDRQARRHYQTTHPGEEFPKRFMCDICGHTTQLHAYLVVHMRTHTREQPFSCPYCDRRFSRQNNRDRHLLLHSGEKPFQCDQCERRFAQSSVLKLHIKTVHLKLPKTWNKKRCKRRRQRDQPLEEPITDFGPSDPQKSASVPTADYLGAFINYKNQ